MQMNDGPLSQAEVTRLAIYNGEASRGVVHIEAYRNEMAALQERFNRVGYELPPKRSWWQRLVGLWP